MSPTIELCKHTDVMKVLSDRFPKTPSDFAAVWDQFERAALEKSVPKDVETIEVLRHQIEELNAAKVMIY